jgi:hypothetical protein
VLLFVATDYSADDFLIDLKVPLLSQMPVEPMPSAPEPSGSPGPM